MVQRKKAKELLKGNHGAARTGEIVPAFADLNQDPPDYLSQYAKDIYKELYQELKSGGSLKITDYPVFVSFCVEVGMVRESSEQLKQGLFLTNDKGVFVNPAEKQFRLHSQNLLKLAVELGLSPKARNGVSITKTDKVSRNDAIKGILNFNKG